LRTKELKYVIIKDKSMREKAIVFDPTLVHADIYRYNETTEIVSEEINNDEKAALIDLNNNGTISIIEAKESGYSIPIYKENWIYDYMIDIDDDGIIEETP
jgi:hypothetical protein